MTEKLTRTSAAITSPATEAEWIRIFPAGTTKGRDGRGPYILKDAEAVVKASMADGVELPVDREHGMDLHPGTDVPAAGWIKELQAREDGIHARVEWTERGAEQLKNREYRYVSPTFMHTPAGVVKRIERLALTNNPNFNMKAIASAEEPKENSMDELKKIAAIVGLAEDATADAIAEAVQKLQDTVSQVKEKVDAPADAAPEAVAEAVDAKIEKEAEKKTETAMASFQAKNPDPSKFAPLSDLKAVQTQLGELQKEKATEKATASVDAAIAAGKLIPAQREWAMSYASQDLSGFDKYVSGAPAVVTPGGSSGKQFNSQDGNGLDGDQTSICSMLGVAPDKFKEQLKKSS